MNDFACYSHHLGFAGALSACSSGNQSAALRPEADAAGGRAAVQERDTERQQLEQIPPPAKSRYMAIHTRESWGNPFLIVGKKTVTLRIMYPEGPQSDLAPGGTDASGERPQARTCFRLSDLPEALAAIPEQDMALRPRDRRRRRSLAARADRMQVRRNVETTMQVLNDLGVVVYEWPSSGVLR